MMRGSVETRFWAKVERRGARECWPWKGYLTPDGYGTFHLHGSNTTAQRVAVMLDGRDIPEGKWIDHLCRNRACVNPAHLEIVSPRENVMRGDLPAIMRAKGAAVTHCPKGHEYTPENTSKHLSTSGHWCRQCRACKRAYYKQWWAANRSKTAA